MKPRFEAKFSVDFTAQSLYSIRRVIRGTPSLPARIPAERAWARADGQRNRADISRQADGAQWRLRVRENEKKTQFGAQAGALLSFESYGACANVRNLA